MCMYPSNANGMSSMYCAVVELDILSGPLFHSLLLALQLLVNVDMFGRVYKMHVCTVHMV